MEQGGEESVTETSHTPVDHKAERLEPEPPLVGTVFQSQGLGTDFQSWASAPRGQPSESMPPGLELAVGKALSSLAPFRDCHLFLHTDPF